ncbi:hypothetical protein Hanom_Chr03g00235371 [Helianthus anomalus]
MWTARIRVNFLHPSSESVAAYGTIILGAPSVAKVDLGKSPTREGAILLLSEESTGSSHGLIHPLSRAEPEQKEAEKKKIEERETEKKKSAEEPVSAPTRKCFSKVEMLDYVVVSDSLSGLDEGLDDLDRIWMIKRP